MSPVSTTTTSILYSTEAVRLSPIWETDSVHMKFTITREQLQEGLAAVAAAIPAKTTLPVLANVLVEATKQGLRLSGTDLDIAVSTTVPADVDADGAVTLPAKKLVDIARELPAGPVRVTAAGEARVSIESGRSKFKLLGLPREEFPSVPTVKFEKAWKEAAGVVHKRVGPLHPSRCCLPRLVELHRRERGKLLPRQASSLNLER